MTPKDGIQDNPTPLRWNRSTNQWGKGTGWMTVAANWTYHQNTGVELLKRIFTAVILFFFSFSTISTDSKRFWASDALISSCLFVFYVHLFVSYPLKQCGLGYVTPWFEPRTTLSDHIVFSLSFWHVLPPHIFCVHHSLQGVLFWHFIKINEKKIDLTGMLLRRTYHTVSV